MKGRYDNRLFIQQCGNSVKSQKKCDFELDLQKKKTCIGVYKGNGVSSALLAAAEPSGEAGSDSSDQSDRSDDRGSRELIRRTRRERRARKTGHATKSPGFRARKKHTGCFTSVRN